MKQVRLAASITLLSALAVVGCQSEQTTQGGVVGVERKQQMTSFVSAKEIEQQAAQEYSDLMAQAQKKGLLNQNPQYLQRVRTAAQRLEEKLKSKGFDAFIVEAEIESGRWHRVRVGRFSSSQEAEKTRKDLQSKENLANAFVTGK